MGVARGSAHVDSWGMYIDIHTRGSGHEVDTAGPRISKGRGGWKEWHLFLAEKVWGGLCLKWAPSISVLCKNGSL